jgi:hypothetical protein
MIAHARAKATVFSSSPGCSLVYGQRRCFELSTYVRSVVDSVVEEVSRRCTYELYVVCSGGGRATSMRGVR